QLRVPVTGIQFGGKSDRSMPGMEAITYANKAAEMWGVMREWLKTGGTIPEGDNDLHSQLQDREYGYVLRDGRDAIQLESKKDMKKRGLQSPDIADALALTFAYPVQPNAYAGRAAAFNTPRVQHDYDPLHAD
ncbi:MAG: terminase, partial [Stenotrophobium sp.]